MRKYTLHFLLAICALFSGIEVYAQDVLPDQNQIFVFHKKQKLAAQHLPEAVNIVGAGHGLRAMFTFADRVFTLTKTFPKGTTLWEIN